MGNQPGVWAAAALVVLLCAAFVSHTAAQCGEKTPWREGRTSCLDDFYPHQLQLVYTDVLKRPMENGRTVELYSNTCCLRGSEGDIKARKNADACFTTRCTTNRLASFSNICPRREYQGRTLLMEEAMRDHCVGNDNGEQGFVAQCCPQNSTEGMLLSQMGAELSEFPHQAGLSMGCGGTIYNEWYILTAAHCVVGEHTGSVKAASEITVQLGRTIGGHYKFDSNDTKYEVEEVIAHEEYSRRYGKPGWKYGNMYNDVALLKLKRRIDFNNEHIKSLQIAPKGFRPLDHAGNALIAGWGTTDTMELSPHLQKANFVIRSDEDCFEFNEGKWAWGPNAGNRANKDQLLCVGGILNGVWSPTAGAGDSGGPAICRGPDGYAVLCGITSYGRTTDQECADNDNQENCPPSVYVEVEHFRDWIKGIAGKQDSSTFFRYKLYGEEAPQNKYNHQVHITSSSGKACGGTLINKNTVVTASQCVIKNDGSMKPHDNLEVRVGMKDLSSRGKSMRVKVASGVEGFQRVGPPVDPSTQGKHGYSRIQMTDNYHKNDVAVIKLAEDVDDIPESQLAKLPTPWLDPSGLATELSFPRNTTYGSKLMTRQFKFVPRKSCQDRLSRLSRMGVKTKLDDNVSCAVETYSGGSTCDRELGGGLICKGPSGEDVLCGVQIFRLCEFSVPNGFANMGYYAEWVTQASKQMDEMKA